MAEGGSNFTGSQSQGRRIKRPRTLSWIRILISDSFPSYFEIKDKQTILKALEVIETDVLFSKPIHWDRLLCVVRAMVLDCKPECLKFLKELFTLFERYQCRDLSLISEVFLYMHFLTTGNLTDTDLDKSMEIRKSFYTSYGEELIFLQKMDLVYNAASSANLGLLKLQLKFGMGMMTPPITVDTCLKEISMLLEDWVPGVPRFLTLRRAEWKICKKNCSMLSFESRKRMLLILRMLKIIHKMQTKDLKIRENFAECYKLLFDSIPEAYITSTEVKATLEICLPYTCYTLISQMSEEFKRQLPELAEVPQPRCLKHLSRIQVRQSLRQNRNLPHGVTSLQIPTTLKKYILLLDDGNYNVKERTLMGFIDLGGNQIWTKLCLNIPERDDCLISFFKNL